ncbi:MAG TPA: multicopper oxidase domain-containing protein [Burkholderiales bacterium]|nr:multicopper oxidase domain-containing protein [Burkholderiales bacterium]
MNTRRKWLLAAGAVAAGATGGLLWQRRREELAPDRRAEPPGPAPVRDPAFPNALRLPGADGMYGILDVGGPIAIVARPIQHALYPGKPAAMLGFEVQHQGNNYLNPLLRVRRGTTVRADFWNALDETSIIHWHGLKVDANNDGHPHYAIKAGATHAYHYPVSNRAATYWYHPHAHGRTAAQIHQGLAGLYLVDDDEDQALRTALDLTTGVTDVPLVLQDKRIDGNGAPVYAPTEAEWMHGYLGNDVLVNLTSRPHLDVTARIYRFRLLNASMARVYRLAFTSGDRSLEFALLGGDGGLLPQPRAAQEAYLSPGERLDVALDLRSAGSGATVTLHSLEFDPMHHDAARSAREAGAAHAHTRHHDEGTANPASAQPAPIPDGAALELMKLYVYPARDPARELPATLSASEDPDFSDASVRRIRIDHHRMAWRINGRLFDMRGIGLTVRRGAKEIWEIANPADGMPHPMHIHGFHFRVLERSGSPEQVRRLALAEHGLTASDLGWKDTVMIWPGETVRIALEFSHSYLGDQVYMFHCHNLQHADRGMMVNVRVANVNGTGYGL